MDTNNNYTPMATGMTDECGGEVSVLELRLVHRAQFLAERDAMFPGLAFVKQGDNLQGG